MIEMDRISFNSLSSKIRCDLFICSASFEERCLAVASHFPKDSANSVLVCHYLGPNHKSDSNYEKLMQMFPTKGKEVLLYKNNPLSNYDALYDAIEAANCKSVLFDITTLTRETLLIVMVLFRQDKFKDIDVSFCYTPAKGYLDTVSEDYSKLWLTRGVQMTRTVLGLSGFISTLKKNLLIVLVGIETERASILINNFEADKVYLGYAPSYMSQTDNVAKMNKESFEKLKTKHGDNCEEFEFSCKDISKTKLAITDIIDKNKDDYNIIISPMNNKLSTIAVGLVALENPSVQVCYASTNQYNTEAYSSPADYAYIINPYQY